MEEEATQLGGAAGIGPVADMGPLAIAAMGLLAAILGVLTMWLAAVILNIKDASLGRSVLAALAMSVLTVTAAGVLAKTADSGLPFVAAAGIALAVMALKMVFRTSVWKAVGVLILNGMMQIIISSLYLQARMGGAFPSGPS